MEHSIILDIETLAIVPQAVVFDIALVAVRRSDQQIAAELSLRLSVEDQLTAGRITDADTIEFHRQRGTGPPHTGLSVAAAIEAVAEFFATFPPLHVWISGPDFDRPVLEDLWRSQGEVLPWKYSATRDVRTAWSLAFPDEKRPLPPHKALEDCRASLVNLRRALEAIGRLEAI